MRRDDSHQKGRKHDQHPSPCNPCNSCNPFNSPPLLPLPLPAPRPEPPRPGQPLPRTAPLRVPGQPAGHRYPATAPELGARIQAAGGEANRVSDSRGQQRGPVEVELPATCGTPGRWQSDQTLHVVYAGKALPSCQRCYWKVRVWDKDGKASAYSRPACWEMGLLSPQDWQGQWIGRTDGHQFPARAPAPPRLHARWQDQAGPRLHLRARLLRASPQRQEDRRPPARPGLHPL